MNCGKERLPRAALHHETKKTSFCRILCIIFEALLRECRDVTDHTTYITCFTGTLSYFLSWNTNRLVDTEEHCWPVDCKNLEEIEVDHEK